MAVETLILKTARIESTGDKVVPILIPIQWLLTSIFLTLCGFVTVLFLPALLELKRPRDPGPRKITGIGTLSVKQDLNGPSSSLPESLTLSLIDLENGEIFKPDMDACWMMVKAGLTIDIEG